MLWGYRADMNNYLMLFSIVMIALQGKIMSFSNRLKANFYKILDFCRFPVDTFDRCYSSLLGNRLVNLGISKQQHLYLRTKNLI